MGNDTGTKEDIWEITETNPESQNFGRTYHFDFSYICAPEIRETVKRYTAGCHKTGSNTVSKLYTDLVNFKYFNLFAAGKGLERFQDMDRGTIHEFLVFIRTVNSIQRGKPLSYRYQKKLLDGLKSIISWCRIYAPEQVPVEELFTGKEYTRTNERLKIDYIPDEVVLQVNTALEKERNLLLKQGIVIMECTGMRRGDLLALKTGCIICSPVGGVMMQWYDHKAGKQRKPVAVPEKCVQAVRQVEEETAELRRNAPEELKDYLFLHSCERRGNDYGKIQRIHPSTLDAWLKRFVKEHDIRDSAGELYHLTPHRFRRTLGTDMLSKGIGIHTIQELLGHSAPETTKRFYSDVKDREHAETFRKVGIIGDIRRIGLEHFENVEELEWFRINREKSACLCDGYCTRPVTEGKICERLLKRQKCYSCSRYITTPEYLEIHRRHLAALEKQVETGRIYGEHYTSHFLPVIEVLKTIIKELEGMETENR